MSMIFFTFRAPMTARRGAEVLREAGIPGVLTKTPARIATSGCGYSIKVPQGQEYAAAMELQGRGARYERSFLLERGQVREVQL